MIKRLIAVCILLLVCSPLFSLAQTGEITGLVKLSDGTALPWAPASSMPMIERMSGTKNSMWWKVRSSKTTSFSWE